MTVSEFHANGSGGRKARGGPGPVCTARGSGGSEGRRGDVKIRQAAETIDQALIQAEPAR